MGPKVWLLLFTKTLLHKVNNNFALHLV